MVASGTTAEKGRPLASTPLMVRRQEAPEASIGSSKGCVYTSSTVPRLARKGSNLGKQTWQPGRMVSSGRLR